MTSFARRVVVVAAIFLVLLWPALVLASVQAVFSLDTPAGGPFPSDRFTVEDQTNNTGLRVALPKPPCSTRPSDCADVDVINTVDGFNLQPRLSIPFDGPIDVATATSHTVFLIRLGSTLEDRGERSQHDDDGDRPRRDKHDETIGINQVVWDPATNTLHAESDALLDQHTRYALIVTDGIHDSFGAPVTASEGFRQFRHDLNAAVRHDGRLNAYRKALLDGLKAARRAGISPAHIVVLSVFTTQSATATLEHIRDQLKATRAPRADFALAPDGTRTVFAVPSLRSIVFTHQDGTAPTFTPQILPIFLLTDIIPGTVGTVAFGKYRSVDYETPEKYIPEVGTRSGTPAPQRGEDIYFNLYLPTGSKPPGGWPVAIFGHAFMSSKNIVSMAVAATMAQAGIATIAINVVGHGFGPLSTLTVTSTSGHTVTFSAGGRGIDQDGNGTIDAGEGFAAAPPRGIIGARDGYQQTVVDLMQLVRVIQAGADVDGDGIADLDPTRIYYFGQSVGGSYGTMFLAIEPAVRAGVLVAFGGSSIESTRLSRVFRDSLVGADLAARVPSLINVGGITFNENMPLRDQPPVINTVAGAMEIQEYIDNRVWVRQAANPVAYAPYLRKDPLEGVPVKPVIIQFAKGDQDVPNPTTTAVLRAGDLADRATFFRYDLVFQANPTFPKDPHPYLFPAFPGFPPAMDQFALAAQKQIARFFASDGEVTIDPDGAGPIFEVPIVPPLPETVNFID